MGSNGHRYNLQLARNRSTGKPRYKRTKAKSQVRHTVTHTHLTRLTQRHVFNADDRFRRPTQQKAHNRVPSRTIDAFQRRRVGRDPSQSAPGRSLENVSGRRARVGEKAVKG